MGNLDGKWEAFLDEHWANNRGAYEKVCNPDVLKDAFEKLQNHHSPLERHEFLNSKIFKRRAEACLVAAINADKAKREKASSGSTDKANVGSVPWGARNRCTRALPRCWPCYRDEREWWTRGDYEDPRIKNRFKSYSEYLEHQKAETNEDGFWRKRKGRRLPSIRRSAFESRNAAIPLSGSLSARIPVSGSLSRLAAIPLCETDTATMPTQPELECASSESALTSIPVVGAVLCAVGCAVRCYYRQLKKRVRRDSFGFKPDDQRASLTAAELAV